MKLSLIIPGYNEEKIIASTIEQCESYLSQNFTDFELIFVDDGSRDKTKEVAMGASKLKSTKIIGYPANKGKGCAVRTGILASTGDVVVYTDADLAFGLDVVKRAYDQVTTRKLDLLLGSRQNDGYENYPFIRKVASKVFLMVLRVFGLKYSDSQCGIKGLRGDFARKVFSKCTTDRFAFDFEMILIAEKLKGKIGEFEVKIVNHRESSVNIIKDSINMLKELVRIKNYVRKI
ncbi:MAG: glycosyltransferase [Clostridia bacterium]|nr:glycosyltransferase [Clostridia bacterium]